MPTTAENLLVQAENLSFRYANKHWVFKDYSVSIPKGKFSVIVGDNGSGKTTLMYLLMGKLKPHNKALFYIAPEVENHTSVIPYYHFFPDGLPISKELLEAFFNRYQLQMPAFLSSLDTVITSELSNGQRRFTEILYTVIQENIKAVFVDEPLALLDGKLSAELFKLMSVLCSKENKSIVITIQPQLLNNLNLNDEYHEICL